jgi:broad-specificity NMP kinase
MSGFEELSDYDFEQLVADLLSAEWNVRVENFPRGRDGGVDLRVLGPAGAPLHLAAGDELVVQCKHRPHAVLAGLRSDLRLEAAKPIVDEAARYVLATSARLTRANKQQVVALFGHRMTERDVLAREDLTALLRRHPEVERANIKLLLTSAAALQALLNQTEHLRSAALEAELLRLRSTFVETAVLRQARRILDQIGVCVLAGPPGVGKTTTASLLLLQYMADGWRPVVAVSEVRELEAQLQPNVKQVLFFDDFLGQNSLEAKLARGEDSALVRLIHAIEHDPNKIFILTTREYVLQQAKQSYEKLGDRIFELAKVAVNVEEITASQRAHILYNQLYFSPLRAQAAAALDGPRRYAELTAHPNYNPRLIEAAILAGVRDLGLPRERQRRTSSLSGSGGSLDAEQVASVRTASDGDTLGLDVPDMLRRALDNPAELWDHVLQHQLTALQRNLLVARISLGPSLVYLTGLMDAGSAFAGAMGSKPDAVGLDAALRVLDGDLLAVNDTKGGRQKATLDSLKPGVTDAVLDFLGRYPDNLLALATSAVFFEQVRWIAGVVGIVNDRRGRHPRESVDQRLVCILAESAERTLMSPPATAGLWPWVRTPGFDDFGQRLEVLAAIYTAAGLRPSAGLAGQVLPPFVNVMREVMHDELARVVAVLRAEPFDAWRSRRTEIDVVALRLLGDPDDLSSWSLLRDVVDVVDTTPEYQAEMVARFEEFAEEFVSRGEEILEGDEDDFDSDLLSELDQLEVIAERWGTSELEISEIAERLRDLEGQYDPRPIKERHSLTTASETPERTTNGSIFDLL